MQLPQDEIWLIHLKKKKSLKSLYSYFFKSQRLPAWKGDIGNSILRLLYELWINRLWDLRSAEQCIRYWWNRVAHPVQLLAGIVIYHRILFFISTNEADPRRETKSATHEAFHKAGMLYITETLLAQGEGKKHWIQLKPESIQAYRGKWIQMWWGDECDSSCIMYIYTLMCIYIWKNRMKVKTTGQLVKCRKGLRKMVISHVSRAHSVN